ncbi:hypothetical protein HWV00_00685 [Moritella sp. 24]|uniref:hypothetical protein n=1 Tax=Moritella sp. 24 TaxID=2746230 RepID=UPI001BA52470|nr:hypothetical protein [Moritella sp. 24]QUM74890.1 hypothetical protein HWV00_00685 [Moritella sp. 24]
MNIEITPNLSHDAYQIDTAKQNNSAILKTVQNIMITTLLCLVVIAVQRLDYFWLENSLGEESVTELLQAVLLLFSVVCFYQLKHLNVLPKAAMLVGGFFSVLFIRELDGYFDLIFHGFWVYPALTVAFGAIVYAAQGGQLHTQMSTLLENKYMQTLITFIVLLFVFSRLYGMGDFWEGVMGNQYVRDVKNISEETMELLFYTFIAFYAHKTKTSLTQKQA